jgi:heterodisulfide reductase subunit A
LKEDTSTIDLTTAKINLEKCTKCGLCIEECNYSAITDTCEIIDIACRGCGKCAAVCPEGAIEIRHLTTNQLKSQIDGILSIDSSSIIVYVTETCGYNAADIAGTSRREYPSQIKIVKLPCVGRLSIDDMIYPLKKGAKSVMIVACPRGLCHYIDGDLAAKEKVEKAKKILDKKNIGREKLHFFEIVSPDGIKFQKICREEAAKIEEISND